MKKTKEAVSLIVLVLTIVIMIILAGVIVINLNNSGIIDRAKGAVSETNLKNMQELANVAWGEAYLAIKGEKTPENLKSTMLEKLKGKGVNDDELGKYTFVVTTGGVEVAVNTGSNMPDEPGTEPEPEVPQINVALNPSGTIPEGAVYYRGTFDEDSYYNTNGFGSSYLLEYCNNNATEILREGEEFPEEPDEGDVYIHGAYIYVYNASIDDSEFTVGEAENKWYVMYNGTSEDLTILESINGNVIDNLDWTFANFGYPENLSELIIPATITSMEYTFYYCVRLVEAPIIPNSIESMWGTFFGCADLNKVTINATPEYYDYCLVGTSINDITDISGTCNNKEDIFNTIYD